MANNISILVAKASPQKRSLEKAQRRRVSRPHRRTRAEALSIALDLWFSRPESVADRYREALWAEMLDAAQARL